MRTAPALPRFLTCGLMLILGLAACGEMPEVEGRISPETAAAPWPDLVPAERIVAAGERQRIEPGEDDALRARADRLRARAAALKRRTAGS